MATPIEPAATPNPAMTQPCFKSRNCRSPVPKGTEAEAQSAPPSLVRKTLSSLMPQPLFSSTMWMDTSEGEDTTGALTGGTGAGVSGGSVGPCVTGTGTTSGLLQAEISTAARTKYG